MTTFTALTTVPGPDAAAALGQALEALTPTPMGVGVFEIEDGSGLWEVGGYFDGAPDLAGLAVLAAVHGARDFAVSRLDDRDWVAQVRRELTPVAAGRFVVFGSHDAHRVPIWKTGLRIDAAMAFGTGHHGTTLGCLQAIDRLAKGGVAPRRMADIGTGTGVLAMAAVRAWGIRAIASDFDPVATDTARANCGANGCGARVQCVTGPGFAHRALAMSAPFDLITANILANPLRRLAPDMARYAAVGGWIILSGILNRQAAGVVAVYRGHRIRLMHRITIGDWTTLILKRW